jgi:hypothetical protein
LPAGGAIHGIMVTMDKPKVVAWFVDAPVAEDDPHRAVKLRAGDIDQAAEVLEEATRAGEVSARADQLEEATALFSDSAFDPGQVWDAALQVGLSDADLDAAAHVAVVLRETELGRGG